MRILHFSDVHVEDRAIEEVRTCLGYIVEQAQGLTPDLIVMAGDTFNNRLVKLDSQAAKLIFEMYARLADIAPMVVIVGTPSHDGLTVQVLSHIIGRYPIYVSDFPEQIFFTGTAFFSAPPVMVDCEAVISCIPTPTKQYWQEYGGKHQSAKETDAEVAKAMGVMLADFGAKASEYDCPHILVGHFSVGGAFVSETQQLIGVDIELSRDQIGLANADLVCLGHIHLRQRIGENIFYSGSIYRKDFGELEAKGFYLHEVDPGIPKQYKSQFIETPTRKLVKIKHDFIDSPISELDLSLYSLDEDEVKDAVVRVEIKAYQDDADKLKEEDIKSFYMSAGARMVDLKIQRVPRETVRSAKLLELQTLREKIREMALLRKEDAPESILIKADMLEGMTPDAIYKEIGNA